MISRRWLAFCIIILSLTIIMLVAVYVTEPLIKWNSNMYLTPIFFRNDGDEYLYLRFWVSAKCDTAHISDTSKVCSVLKRCFFANTLLNASLLIGFVLTSSTIILAIFMLKRHFFRFTNVLILVSGLNFIVMTVVWYFMSGTWDPDVKPGAGLFLIPAAGTNQLLCYIVSRWYTNKLYDANFIETLLGDSDSSEEEEESEESHSE